MFTFPAAIAIDDIKWRYVEAREPVVYEATTTPEVVKPVQIVVKIDWTEERIEKEVRTKAKEYGASFSQMWATINCENPDLDPNLQSYVVQKGVREDSWGLAQIHLPSWPNISREQAQDPEFAIDFMAKHFAAGNHRLWTCWRMIYLED